MCFVHIHTYARRQVLFVQVFSCMATSNFKALCMSRRGGADCMNFPRSQGGGGEGGRDPPDSYELITIYVSVYLYIKQ